jgi:TetR/AcrR family transcriptional repressor of bet genes
MAKPKNTEERRGQIVTGLLSAMAENGYDGATIPKIARAAGLTPGLVHYHFQSKQQILLALVDQLMDRLQQRYESRLKRKGISAGQRLFAYLDAHVKKGPDAIPEAVSAWIAIGAEAVRQPEVQQVFQQATKQRLSTLRSLVTNALKEEGRKTRNSRAIATGLLSAIEGAFQLSGAAPRILPPGFAAPTLKRMAEGLIHAEPVTE